MKYFFLSFILTISISSCFNYYPQMTGYAETEKYQFTNIPIKTSVDKIKVYFPGEKYPEEPYIKVDLLDVFASPYTSTAEMVDNLEKQAKSKGVDAIIIFGKDNISELFEDDVYGNHTVTTQRLSALGIKFIKNIDYLDECMKRLSILKWDEKKNDFVEKTKIKTDWKGNVLELESGEEFYYNFLYNFSLQHLAFEKDKTWSYLESSTSSAETTIKRIKNKRTKEGCEITKRVAVNEVYEKIVYVKVTSIDSKAYSGKINFHYDKAGRLIQKDINSKGLGAYQQKFFYTEAGILSHFEIHSIKDGEPEIYIKGSFERYKQLDLVDLLEKDQE